MADIELDPDDDPNSVSSQYVRAIREWHAHEKAGRVDEMLRAHAHRAEAERIAAENPERYAEILAEVRNQSRERGL